MSVVNSPFIFTTEALGHLLADKWLAVPPYQRAYAWEEEQVEEFWADLEAAVHEKRAYFMGAVVMTNTGGVCQVIDGQQRLATTSLLFAAIRDELALLKNAPLEQHVEGRYLRSYDRKSASVLPRLTIAPADNRFYISRFLERSGGEPTTTSQKGLTDAFSLLRKRVAGLLPDGDAKARSVAINQWIDHLEQHVLVVLVETPSEADAFQIFETLNDRGAMLTIADLLKNYLMSQARQDTEELGMLWSEAVANLGAEVGTLEFVSFLRYFWNSHVGATRERDLYSSIRTHINTAPEAAALVQKISKASTAYAALLDPMHTAWSEGPDEAQRAIDTLLYFQLGQYRPLLLAAIEILGIPEAARFATALVSWSYRGLIYGGIGGGTAERVYATAAVAIRNGKISSVREAFKIIRQIVPSDEDFRNAFERASIRRVRFAHYTMRALERGQLGVSCAALEPFPPEKQAYVSGHLLPRRPDASWSTFAKDDVDRYAYLVGNLILKQPMAHGPADASERLKWARELGPSVNALLPVSPWNPNALKHRQQDLAALAVKVWPREPS